MKDRVVPLFFAFLVVVSMLPAGLATAQTTETYSQTFTDSAELYLIETSNFSGSFTLQVNAHEDTPSGSTTTIYQEEFSGSDGRMEGHFAFANYGAYSNLTLKAIPANSASGAINFSSTNDLATHNKRVATTGGDADFQCELGGSIAKLTIPNRHQIDCNPLPGTTQVDTTNTDANQTKADIYQSGQNSKAAGDIHRTSLDNHLNDAKTIARIKGKNAYIKALNNGSSEAAARSAAKSAVSEYYARQQKALSDQYSRHVLNMKYLDDTVDNESGIDDIYVSPEFGKTSKSNTDFHSFPTTQVTLLDGTTYNTTGYRVATSGGTGDTNGKYFVHTNDTSSSTGASPGDFGYVRIHPPDSSYDNLVAVTVVDWQNQWATIKSQRDTVHGEMDTLVNNTYSAYQDGEINNSDLVDPYVLASEYSPGTEYQGWTAAQLTLMGTNSPENFDQIGRFNITMENGAGYQGVLFSQDNPASGQFATNTTYDPSAINGTQYVVTADSTTELTENFTIGSIETHDGETRQNVTIVKKQYSTTNTTELKQLYEDLAFERAQIEAREKALKAEGGGGGFLNGGGSVPPMAAVGFVAAIVLLALVND